MATLHTVKFEVEVQYRGSEKDFDDLFKPNQYIKSYHPQVISSETAKIASKPIRSTDQQIIREFLKEAVQKAGYKVGNFDHIPNPSAIRRLMNPKLWTIA